MNLRYRYTSPRYETVAMRSGSPVRFATNNGAPIGYVAEGILFGNQNLKYRHQFGGTTYTSTAQFKGLSPVVISSTSPISNRYVTVGVLNQAITSPITVPANSQIAINGDGVLTHTALGTSSPDSDGDGFTDAEEDIANTLPNDASSAPPFLPGTPTVGQIPQNIKAFVCYGNGPEGQARTGTPVSHELPAGSSAYVVVLAINTEEFFYYTRSNSEFNDTVTWSVNVNGQPFAPQTTTNVNALHADFFRSWLTNSSFFDYTSVHTRVLGVIPANPSGPTTVTASLAVKNIGDSALYTSAVVALLPVEFKLMWENKNKANQIWNSTKKDDPASAGQQPNSVSQLDGVPRNKLYAVTDPADGKYKVTVELGLPEGSGTKFFAAAYLGETKVAASDKAFTDEGLCNLEFAHPGASGDIADFAIRVGYDANNSTTLDPAEQMKLSIHTTSAKDATGEPFVRGTNADQYAEAIDEVDDIVDGAWTSPGWATDLVLPHAKRFLQIFRDGNFSALPVAMQPSSSRVVAFNAFNGLFCEWLTHNSGAPFNDDGAANILEHTWDKTKSASQLVSRGKQIKDAINAHFSSTLDAHVRSEFENQPTGTVRYYPSETGAYDLIRNHESPSWVTKTSVLFHDLPQVPPLPKLDDLNGTIGRGRLGFHKVRYRVERKIVPGPPGTTLEELNVTAYTTGEVWDLYDWNHDVTGAAQNPAILQVGFGKGAYGSDRDRGKIYLTHIPFDDIYDIRQIPTWP